jgi:hypothetical protein
MALITAPGQLRPIRLEGTFKLPNDRILREFSEFAVRMVPDV